MVVHLDLSQVDDLIGRVIVTSLKEERHQIFSSWATALLNKDWEACDTCATLLLHTLASESEHRTNLEEWIDNVNTKYRDENLLLQNLINAQINPFQREQLKEKKPELDEWRAKEIHNQFYLIFSKESLIEKEK